MGEECEVFIKSSVRGYHAYFVDASVTGKISVQVPTSLCMRF